MGQISTEQTVRIIEAVGESVQPQPVTTEPNYWWLMLIAIIPVMLAPFIANWFKRRRKP